MEILRRAQLVGKSDFQGLETLLVAAAIYWGLTTVLRVQVRLESAWPRATGGLRRARVTPRAPTRSPSRPVRRSPER